MEHPRVASIRLGLSADADDDLKQASEILLRMTDGQNLSVLVENRSDLVRPLGLDGVHLSGGPGQVRSARALLGSEYTVGANCGTTRHAGIRAGEAGADYVSFGPVFHTGPDGREVARPELFRWWHEFTVLPSVAEGGLTANTAHQLSDCADFLLIEPGVWRSDDSSHGLAGF